MITYRQAISRKSRASSSNIQRKQELNNKAWEEFVAYQFLKNANSAKYGHVIRHLKERKNIGKDEFPKTLTLAINTLSMQQFRNDKDNRQNKR